MKNKLLAGIISLSLVFSMVACIGKTENLKNNPSGSNIENNKKDQAPKYKDTENIEVGNKDKQLENKEDKEKEDKNKEVVSPNKDNNKSDNENIKNLNLTDREWFFIPNTKGNQPDEPKEVLDIIKNKDAYYVGSKDKKVLYLTFDEGYENGYTTKILDILKENNVKAAFFVTEPYIKANKELIKRMVQEGHLVCNHSKRHPSMAKLAKSNKNEFNNEILSTEKTFEQVSGKKMDKFFRPPMGAYNELSLYYTQKLGYKTVFWSVAYRDYEVDDQPSVDEAKTILLNRTHNGAVILLHAISKTNTEVLDYLIHEWRNRGYDFKSLTNLS